VQLGCLSQASDGPASSSVSELGFAHFRGLSTWLAVFRPSFTVPTLRRVLALMANAVLAPGKPTITEAPLVVSLAEQVGFARNRERCRTGCAGVQATAKCPRVALGCNVSETRV